MALCSAIRDGNDNEALGQSKLLMNGTESWWHDVAVLSLCPWNHQIFLQQERTKNTWFPNQSWYGVTVTFCPLLHFLVQEISIFYSTPDLLAKLNTYIHYTSPVSRFLNCNWNFICSLSISYLKYMDTYVHLLLCHIWILQKRCIKTTNMFRHTYLKSWSS